MCEPDGPAADYLSKLGAELSARGMGCELVTTGWVPRLRLEIPWRWVSGRFTDSAFGDHVVAAAFGDGQWRFWWPWIEPIAPVDDVGGAADHILRNTLELFMQDADGEIEEASKMPAQTVSAGCQHGSCESCELMRGLAGQLQARGLNVRILSDAGTSAGSSQRIEGIEVTNPPHPGTGRCALVTMAACCGSTGGNSTASTTSEK